MSVSSPVVLNNDAVSLLAKGNQQNAACALQKALSCTQIMMNELPLRQPTTSNDDSHAPYKSSAISSSPSFLTDEEDWNTTTQTDIMMIEDESMDEPPTNDQERTVKIRSVTVAEDLLLPAVGGNGEPSADSCFFFNRALVIQCAEDDHDDYSTDSTPCDCDTSSASLSAPENIKVFSVLLYNIGLSYHINGIRTGDSKQFLKALQHYEYSFVVVETIKDSVEMEGILLLLMSIFNNMAHIHRFFCNSSKLQHCVSWLKTAANHHLSENLCLEDFMFFYMNTIVAPFAQLNLAPAA